jgi:outer membrane usher protein
VAPRTVTAAATVLALWTVALPVRAQTATHGPSLDSLLAPPPAPPASSPRSSPVSATGARALRRAYFDIRMNGQPRGDTAALLDGEDLWLPVEDLHGFGVQSFEGARLRQDGKEWVSLGSLSPQLRFAIDTDALRLELSVGPGLMPTGMVEIGYGRPKGTIVGDSTAGFLNYAAQVDLQGHASGFGEIGFSSGPALATTAFSVGPDGLPVRGLTAFTYDFLPRLETLTVGDAAISAGAIGTSAVVGGVTWARNFRLDPYLVVAPRPSFSAFAATPSTVEVWVNGMLVRQQSIPAGTIDLANIPVASGSSDVRTVVRDAFGREQVYDLRANLAPQLLAPGLSEFAYTLGFVREAASSASFSYTRPVALGRHRVGLDDVLTVGGRAEASLDRFMAGPSLTVGTLVGQFDVEAVGSVAQGITGGAGSAGWSWSGRRWGGALRVRGTTPFFSTAVLDPWMDRPVLDLGANFSVLPVERLSLALDLVGSRWRDGGDSASATIRASVAVGFGLTVIASATQTFGGPTAGPSGMLSFSWALGDQTTAQASTGGGAQGMTGSAGASRPLPPGAGYGYRVQGDLATGVQSASGLFQYQTGFGRYEAQVDQVNATTLGAVRAAGGFVVAADRVFATRPVEEAYALVRVGVPGVTTYLENQPVGVTDDQGDVLIPSLLARYSNRISIRAADIPMDYEVGKVELLAAPFRKGGMVVRFDVNPIRAVTGRLRLEGEGQGAPARGELVVVQDGAELRAPTSSEGRFFLEGARPGVHAAVVTWAGGRCRATFQIPERAGMQDLGVVRCEAALEAAPVVAAR